MAGARDAAPPERPALRRGVRMAYDEARARHALLYPEGVLLLNETAAAVLRRCDGARTVADIVADLGRSYAGVAAEEVAGLLAGLAGRRLLADGTGPGTWNPAPGLAPAAPGERRRPMPLGLLAEVSYRCPLRCPYCSNPLNLNDYRDELTTAEWCRVLDEARELGVLQVHLSGGEPLVRGDLATLVGHAHDLGMYTGLVTSGVGLTDRTFAALAGAGLDHVQLSVQDADPASADRIAGLRAHERKLAAAAVVRAHGTPLTLNVVLHRANIGRVPAIADLAVAVGADRLELANTQFYGWAGANLAALLPTREQLAAAERDARRAEREHGARLEIVYVAADYVEARPKPCMYGWGVRQLAVAPNGDVLPCLSAGQLPGLDVPNVRATALGDAWYDSAAFNRFRGTDWMPAPCRDCALREVDFGGCRCQAHQLTGDPAATDPVCELSPDHHVLTGLVAAAHQAGDPAYLPRTMTPSRPA